jgi:hypothetical protein
MGAKRLCGNTNPGFCSRVCGLATAHRRSGPYRRTSSRVSYMLKEREYTRPLLISPVLPFELHLSSTRIPAPDESLKIFDLASLHKIKQTDLPLGRRPSPTEVPPCKQEHPRPIIGGEPPLPRPYQRHPSACFSLATTELLLRILRLQSRPFQSNYHLRAFRAYRSSMMTCSAGIR